MDHAHAAPPHHVHPHSNFHPPSFAHPYDAIVVGAGASGIAAGNALKALGKKFIILEARERIGGRVYTEDWNGFPVELGGEFIHGEKAATNALVHTGNFKLKSVFRFELDNMFWSPDPKIPALPISKLPTDEYHFMMRLRKDMEDLSTIAETRKIEPEISVAEYLKSRGYTPKEISIADILYAQPWCAPIDKLGIYEMVDYIAGGGEYRIESGQESVLQHYAKGLPILFSQNVMHIHYDSSGVTAVTETGKAFRAAKILLSVPIGVMLSHHIRFDPPLPPWKEEVLGQFEMLPATKLVYGFRKRLWSKDLVYLCNLGPIPRFWTNCKSPDSPPYLMSAFITASYAQQLDKESHSSTLQEGLATLATLLALPVDTLKHNLLFTKIQCWDSEKFTKGGYAIRKVGSVVARRDYERPVNDQIYFIGEATGYKTDVQTIHGALDSGMRGAYLTTQKAKM